MSRRWPSVTAHFLRSRACTGKNLSCPDILGSVPVPPLHQTPMLLISNGEVQKLAWHETKNNLVPNVLSEPTPTRYGNLEPGQVTGGPPAPFRRGPAGGCQPRGGRWFGFRTLDANFYLILISGLGEPWLSSLFMGLD